MAGTSWTVEEQPAWLDEVRRFIGQDLPAPPLDTVLATVAFTDIVGSTEKQAELGDRRWKELVLAHHSVVRDGLARWHGVENDTAGDGFYATFDGPARAIRCVSEIIDRVRDLGIQDRAGVHTGECELIDGKAGGLAVSSERGWQRRLEPRRSWSRRRSRTWSRARGSRSRTPASTS